MSSISARWASIAASTAAGVAVAQRGERLLVGLQRALGVVGGAHRHVEHGLELDVDVAHRALQRRVVGEAPHQPVEAALGLHGAWAVLAQRALLGDRGLQRSQPGVIRARRRQPRQRGLQHPPGFQQRAEAVGVGRRGGLEILGHPAREHDRPAPPGPARHDPARLQMRDRRAHAGAGHVHALRQLTLGRQPVPLAHGAAADELEQLIDDVVDDAARADGMDHA